MTKIDSLRHTTHRTVKDGKRRPKRFHLFIILMKEFLLLILMYSKAVT